MAERLIATLVIPLIGATVIGLLQGSVATSRFVALVTTLVTLFFAGLVTYGYVDQPPNADAYAVTALPWLSPESGFDLQLSVGLDGLGVWMFALSALLMVTAVLVSWEAIEKRAAFFYSMLLLLEAGCLGVFVARDVILFYVFFEFTLIPLYFLIGIWGSEQRRYAAIKFFLFTLAGSLLTFLGLLAIVLWDYSQSGRQYLSFSIPGLTASLAEQPVPVWMQVAIFVALFAGFAIKVPLFPLHTWLPLAHVQAPTAGSVILAGILLKIGVYGFARFSLPMLPAGTAHCMPWLLWLSVAGIIYGALVALAQSDVKRLIAYSSVSHLGFCTLGLFALNPPGSQGAVLQMVNHGISTGALFAIVGMIYERLHTREIKKLHGLARQAPWLAFFMLLFTLASIGLPGTNGFAGEFLILLGMFQRGWMEGSDWLAFQLRCISVLAVFGVLLGAWYMLWLVERVFFGPVARDQNPKTISDLGLREKLALMPLAVLVFWIGLYPKFFLDPMQPTLNQLTSSARTQAELVRQSEPETIAAMLPKPVDKLRTIGPFTKKRGMVTRSVSKVESAENLVKEAPRSRVGLP